MLRTIPSDLAQYLDVIDVDFLQESLDSLSPGEEIEFMGCRFLKVGQWIALYEAEEPVGREMIESSDEPLDRNQRMITRTSDAEVLVAFCNWLREKGREGV